MQRLATAYTLLAITAIVSAPASGQTAAAPKIPAMSSTTVEEVTAASKRAFSHIFVGIYERRDGATRLSIGSSRTTLAFQLAKASEEGGRYRPNAGDLIDEVVITCGGGERNATFNCLSVSVRDADGKAVKPTTYGRRLRTYENGFGATWQAYEVTAHYSVGGFDRGFTVTYASVGGAEFDRAVTADEAKQELLLSLPWKRP